MVRIEKELREAVRRAVAAQKKGKVELLVAKKPVRMGISFLSSQFADVAELLPSIKRIDGLRAEYTAKSMAEAYKTLELLVLASSGTQAIMEGLR
jgi:D-amino peptidase